jgi:hypothetical protein
VSFCHHIAFVVLRPSVVCPLTFYILIFFGQISKMWTFLFFIQIWCSFVVVFLCKMPFLMSYHIYLSIKKSYLFYFGKETEHNLKGIENFYFTSNFDAHFIFEMIVSKLYVSVLISPASLRIKWIKRLPKKYKILFFIKV